LEIVPESQREAGDLDGGFAGASGPEVGDQCGLVGGAEGREALQRVGKAGRIFI
jgi:hypothetical protein